MLFRSDAAIVLAALNIKDNWYGTNFTKEYIEDYTKWARAFNDIVRENVGYVNTIIQHHWHGNIFRREYLDRFKYMKDFIPSQHLKYNQDEVFEWAKPNNFLQMGITKYIKGRKEDGENVISDDLYRALHPFPDLSLDEGEFLVGSVIDNQAKNVLLISNSVGASAGYLAHAVAQTDGKLHIVNFSSNNDDFNAAIDKTGLIRRVSLQNVHVSLVDALPKLLAQHKDKDFVYVDLQTQVDHETGPQLLGMVKAGGMFVTKNSHWYIFANPSDKVESFNQVSNVLACKVK